MIQFDDGGFGPITPEAELLAQLARDGVPAAAKAVHFGTEDELAARLDEVRLRDLQRREEHQGASIGAITAAIAELRGQVEQLRADVNAAAVDQHTAGVRVYPAAVIDDEQLLRTAARDALGG